MWVVRRCRNTGRMTLTVKRKLLKALTKVVHRLSKPVYLKAVRGKGGGIKSALLPSEISIGKLIRDIEPLTPAECFVPSYDGQCILYPNCALRRALQSAQLHFLMTLEAYTIADAQAAGVIAKCRAAAIREYPHWRSSHHAAAAPCAALMVSVRAALSAPHRIRRARAPTILWRYPCAVGGQSPPSRADLRPSASHALILQLSGSA